MKLAYKLILLSALVVGCTEGESPPSQSGDNPQTDSSQGGVDSNRPIEATAVIRINAPKDEVVSLLVRLGAIDIGEGMQVANLVSEDPTDVVKDWMWQLDSYHISLETGFEDNKLALLNLWNWDDIEKVAYHHTLEYSEISEIALDKRAGSFQAEVIRVVNAGRGRPSDGP